MASHQESCKTIGSKRTVADMEPEQLQVAIPEPKRKYTKVAHLVDENTCLTCAFGRKLAHNRSAPNCRLNETMTRRGKINKEQNQPDGVPCLACCGNKTRHTYNDMCSKQGYLTQKQQRALIAKQNRDRRAKAKEAREAAAARGELSLYGAPKNPAAFSMMMNRQPNDGSVPSKRICFASLAL